MARIIPEEMRADFSDEFAVAYDEMMATIHHLMLMIAEQPECLGADEMSVGFILGVVLACESSLKGLDTR